MSKPYQIVLVAIVIVIAAAGIAFATSSYLVSKLDGRGTVEQGQALTERYASEAGFSFHYAPNYALSSRTEGNPERQWDVLLLVDKNQAPVGQNTEAPPAIAIGVYPNPEKLPLKQWIQSDARSNFKLSATQQLAQTTVGGKEAYAYTYSGLYENDATAFAVGNNVVVFSVGWLNAQDHMRNDFARILDTVTIDL